MLTPIVIVCWLSGCVMGWDEAVEGYKTQAECEERGNVIAQAMQQAHWGMKGPMSKGLMKCMSPAEAEVEKAKGRGAEEQVS